MVNLARIVVQRPWLVVLVWGLAAAAFNTLGSGLQDRLANRGYEVPGSQSQRADQLAQEFAGGETTRLFVALTSAGDDAGVLRAAAARARDRLASADDVVDMEATVVGRDGRAAVVPVLLRGDAADAQRRVDDLRDLMAGLSNRSVRVGLIGQAAVLDSYSAIAQEDLARAEGFAFPITLVVLLIAFLSVIAAGLPLLLAAVTLTMTFGVLYVVSLLTDMSVFVTNTALLLGVGLCIDYSLFVVSRFREELQAGAGVDAAVIETLRTSGRTVAVSALTVAISLTCLFLVGVGIFSSMAYGASGAALLAGLAATTLLPAVLKLLGPRVDRFAVRRAVVAAQSGRAWRGIADFAIRRRAVVVVAIVVALGALTAPGAGLEIDARGTSLLPASDPVRQLTDRVAASLGPGVSAPVEVFARGDVAELRDRIARTPGVAATSAPQAGRDPGVSRILVGLVEPPDSSEAESTVDRLRAALARGAVVGGPTAQGLDLKRRIENRTPWAIGAAIAVGFLLLLVSLRSLVVPVKAVLTTLLSVGAALGAVALGYELAGDVDTLGYFVPLFLFAIVFGLSVDYELFLLSRVREHYDRTGDNDGAIRAGLVATGRPITLAAVAMITVFLAFAASSLVPLRQVGLGLAFAVLIDATLVRALLVPAALSLLGDRNWWLPWHGSSPSHAAAVGTPRTDEP